MLAGVQLADHGAQLGVLAMAVWQPRGRADQRVHPVRGEHRGSSTARVSPSCGLRQGRPRAARDLGQRLEDADDLGALVADHLLDAAAAAEAGREHAASARADDHVGVADRAEKQVLQGGQRSGHPGGAGQAARTEDETDAGPGPRGAQNNGTHGQKTTWRSASWLSSGKAAAVPSGRPQPGASGQAAAGALGTHGQALRRSSVGGLGLIWPRESRSTPVREGGSSERGQELVGRVQARSVAGILDDDRAVRSPALVDLLSTARGLLDAWGWGGRGLFPRAVSRAPRPPPAVGQGRTARVSGDDDVVRAAQPQDWRLGAHPAHVAHRKVRGPWGVRAPCGRLGAMPGQALSRRACLDT